MHACRLKGRADKQGGLKFCITCPFTPTWIIVTTLVTTFRNFENELRGCHVRSEYALPTEVKGICLNSLLVSIKIGGAVLKNRSTKCFVQIETVTANGKQEGR